jgi:hypothetical protein
VTDDCPSSVECKERIIQIEETKRQKLQKSRVSSLSCIRIISAGRVQHNSLYIQRHDVYDAHGDIPVVLLAASQKLQYLLQMDAIQSELNAQLLSTIYGFYLIPYTN